MRLTFLWTAATLPFFLLLVQVSGRCQQGTKSYQVGQIWFPDGLGQCRQCRCDSGDHIVCRSVCKGRFPPDILIQDGLRTESLESDANLLWKRPCVLEGKSYRDGTTWQETGPHSKRLREDECMECNCASQVVTCAIRICPPTSCSNPQHREGTCCKVCKGKTSLRPPRESRSKGCTSIGRQFKDGYRWQLYLPSKNVFIACFSCICQSGKESCRKHACPRPSCSNPVREPGSCCATCKGEDLQISFRGKVQEEDNSTVDGMRPIPILTERSTTTMSNQRPVTLGVSSSSEGGSSHTKLGERDCMFGKKKVYKDKESFHPILEPFGRQKCTKCVCSNRMIKCGRINCPTKYPCKNPQPDPNLCCKKCPGTEDKDAMELERIQMYRTKGCTRVRKSHIQVYRYNYWRPDHLVLKKKYMFDRSLLKNNKMSEIHTLEAIHNKVKVSREQISKSDISKIFLESKWEYIGSVKERVYSRFLMGEVELESCRLGLLCIRRLEQIRQHLESRASKRRSCRSSSVMQSLQRLQEAG